MIGEEFGVERADAEYVWVLDPIDGTRAFIAGVPVWGTLIGLAAQWPAGARHDAPALHAARASSATAARRSYRGAGGERPLRDAACTD